MSVAWGSLLVDPVIVRLLNSNTRAVTRIARFSQSHSGPQSATSSCIGVTRLDIWSFHQPMTFFRPGRTSKLGFSAPRVCRRRPPHHILPEDRPEPRVAEPV